MSEDRQNSNPRQPNRGNGNGDPKMPPVPKFKLNWLYIIIGVALIVLWLNGGNGGAAVKEVAYDPQFKQYISEGKREKAGESGVATPQKPLRASAVGLGLGAALQMYTLMRAPLFSH